MVLSKSQNNAKPYQIGQKRHIYKITARNSRLKLREYEDVLEKSNEQNL